MARLMKGEIRGAIRTLQRNKGRSLLTMFGIIVGVASVVTVAAIGEGIKDQINRQTDRLGRDLITVRPGDLGSYAPDNALGNLTQLTRVSASGSLSMTDVNTVQKTSGVDTAVPLGLVGGGIYSNEHHKQYGGLVVGTVPQFPAMVRQSLAFGAFFDDSAFSVDKVVLGSHIAARLFDENVPLGQTLSILGHQFIVIGILNDFQSTPLSLDADFNNAVFIPYSSALSITHNDTPIYEILARPADAAMTGQVVSQVDGSLLSAHGGQRDFTVLAQSQTINVVSNILNLLTLLIAGVGAIALLVAGVGIMNVTLVSVTERMHEIGIRKAIGATNRQILRQFVIEAAVLSVTGGVIGVLLSFFVEMALRLATSLTPTITWPVVLVACLASVIIGILFGTVPALKAARKDPIAALRGD